MDYLHLKKNYYRKPCINQSFKYPKIYLLHLQNFSLLYVFRDIDHMLICSRNSVMLPALTDSSLHPVKGINCSLCPRKKGKFPQKQTISRYEIFVRAKHNKQLGRHLLTLRQIQLSPISGQDRNTTRGYLPLAIGTNTTSPFAPLSLFLLQRQSLYITKMKQERICPTLWTPLLYS